MRQKRSIKRNIELPVAIHEVRDGERSGCLSLLFVGEERCVGRTRTTGRETGDYLDNTNVNYISSTGEMIS